MKTIEPFRLREPFFDGWKTDKVRYPFSCPSCDKGKDIRFAEICEAAWGWRERTEVRLRSSIASHFGIDLTSRYIGDGMDAVIASKCVRCNQVTYVYFWFHEYRNSCYEISLRGIAIDDI
jgi:hypothetical protein